MESNGTESATEKNKESDDEESTNEEGFEDFLEEDEEDKLFEIDKRKLLRSGVWEFFEVLDEERRVAVCTLCQERLSFRTTSANLAKHLKRKHFIEFVKDDNVKHEIEDEDPRKRSNISAAWKYFEVKDRQRRVAACKLCSQSCSYWSSVSNLMKHVKRKHRVVLMASRQDVDGTNSPPLSAPHASRDVTRSTAWNYFKVLDSNDRLAMCLICDKRLSYRTSVSNLKRHLYRKHPSIKAEGDDAKRVLISSDGQLFEIEETTKQELTQNDDDEEQPTIDIDSVFIDDYEGEVIDKSKWNSKVDRREKKRKKIVIHDTDSSSDEFQKSYTHKKTDSLDQFGKYLVSIMRQLPKEISNQLQADFVKQVMTSQLTFSQQKIPVPSNGYAITITGSEQSTTDHQYVVEEQAVDTQQA